ncbi:hypothetical protein PCC7424_3085 [Gloeothece citriformis PCC 7424]|uniref:Secreted protein n=1 Tax=Gloeothece citriformis (strain PCC 7424) TaxID=65393 RepID=B7KBD1_GLOC7|nr:hypothetical protein [Gloeothece citriformis]ACK71487.1 hypothetical protein PCC7424_3085 [Gloeothece citriformis PCC 7424]
MKRTITLSMTLALVLVSGFNSLVGATNINDNEFQSLTIVSNGDGSCKGDDKDPCVPPPTVNP